MEINELTTALAKAIVNIPPIIKSVKVNFMTKQGQLVDYSYAPLPEINKAITKPLAEQGLVIIHIITNGVLYTRLVHVSGQYLESSVELGKYSLPNIKEFGSEQTYLKRYLIDGLLNLASEDDNDILTTQEKVIPKAASKQIESKANLQIAAYEGDYKELIGKTVSKEDKELFWADKKNHSGWFAKYPNLEVCDNIYREKGYYKKTKGRS